MPLAFLIIGALIIVTAFRGTYGAFYTQLTKDFTGGAGTNFIYWIAAVAILGMLGYSKTFRNPSRALLLLIILAFALANRGVFAQLLSALSETPPQPEVAKEPASPGALPVTISGATGSTGGLGGLLSGLTSLFGGNSTGPAAGGGGFGGGVVR